MEELLRRREEATRQLQHRHAAPEPPASLRPGVHSSLLSSPSRRGSPDPHGQPQWGHPISAWSPSRGAARGHRHYPPVPAGSPGAPLRGGEGGGVSLRYDQPGAPLRRAQSLPPGPHVTQWGPVRDLELPE
jgi:hypothetical protein